MHPAWFNYSFKCLPSTHISRRLSQTCFEARSFIRGVSASNLSSVIRFSCRHSSPLLCRCCITALQAISQNRLDRQRIPPNARTTRRDSAKAQTRRRSACAPRQRRNAHARACVQCVKYLRHIASGFALLVSVLLRKFSRFDRFHRQRDTDSCSHVRAAPHATESKLCRACATRSMRNPFWLVFG